MRELIFACLPLVVAIKPAVALGQPGGEEPKEVRSASHSAYVVLAGASELSPAVAGIAADHINPRLPNWSQADVYESDVVLNYNGQKLDEAPFIPLIVDVHTTEHPDEADMRRLWNIAREQLESELRRLSDIASEAQRRRLERELDRLEAEQHRLQVEAANVTEMLAARQEKSAGMDTKTLAEEIAEALSNQRGLRLEEAGISARREAIERRIDEVIATSSQSEAAKAVISELGKLVDARRQQLNVAKVAVKGGVTVTQIAEAEAQLASAIVELNRARQEAAESGELRELNDELSKLFIQSAEIDGQQKALEEMIAELRQQASDAIRAAPGIAQLEGQLQDIRSQQRRKEAKISELRSQLNAELDDPEISLRPLAADEAKADGEPEASAPGDSAAEDARQD